MKPKIDNLIEFAEEQGVSYEDVLDLLAERSSKKKKNVIQIPTDAATSFFFNEGFSARSWTELRLFLKQFNVELPTRNTIDTEKTKLHPKITSHEIKSFVHYKDLIEDTVKGLLTVSGYTVKPNEKLTLAGKIGLDGSGNHRVRHQLVDYSKSLEENPHLDPENHKNYLLMCFCPLQLSSMENDGTLQVIWKNNEPNSIAYTRPLTLIRTSENRDVIEKEFSELFSEIMTHKMQDISINSQIDIIVKINNTFSMVDGKLANYLQGDSGAPCHYCGQTVANINNIINIMKGFNITKNYESCQSIWADVEKGEIAWKNPKRQGQCHKPLIEIKFFAILHWKLRSFDFLLQLYYRLIANVYLWGEADKAKLALVKTAKQQAIDHLRRKIGILIDTPTTGGGNTNNGVTAERFLSPDSREEICTLIINTEDRENFEILLRDVNIMLTVTQGTHDNVDTDKLKQLGIDIMSLIRTKFVDSNGNAWVSINPSLHAMCAHSWELFQICSGPISQYSEQAQEHWNKFVSQYKSGPGARARQHSVKVNLTDIFARMIIMTHPVVASKRRQILCSHCHQIGHTSRSITQHSYGPIKEDRALINQYFKG